MPTIHPLAEPIDPVALMCDCAAHEELPHSIEVLETHISWLFVTDHFVYKLKKPVRFEFLDFSTSKLRHHACLEEMRLNCRLSPDVYLGVWPITVTETGCLELAGSGNPVDWVVQMRRLPADAALDRRIVAGRVTPEELQAIAELLINFYARLTPERINGEQYRSDLERHLRANAVACIREASQYDRQRIRRVFGQQLLYLRVAAPLLDERVRAGQIVDGHGDLRPEHIFLEATPAIIDCIEFSTELRRVDVLDDLSFLAMECDRLGQGRVGQQIVAACLAARGDSSPLQLLNFYKSYRSLVRAKIVMLRIAQAGKEERTVLMRQAHQYIDWAEHYASQLAPPAIILVGGLMGTGKSTLAREIARAIGARLISTDRIRRTLYGTSDFPAKYGQQIYQPSLRASVYKQLFSRAAAALDSGLSVVLDGTFLTNELRQQAISLGRQHGGAPLYVHCHCPREVGLARLAARSVDGRSDSEGRTELLDQQAAEQDPLADKDASVAIETTLPIPEQKAQVLHRLGPCFDQPPDFA